MFYRIATDGTQTRIPLENTFCGPTRTGCWIIGGGPSLAILPTDRIVATPLPKFSINLAGHQLLRPNFWTAYDPTGRFLRSTYLDPSIMKFIPRGRAMDVVPGTTNKVCDSPNTVFFERDHTVGFHDFLSPFASSNSPDQWRRSETVTDWQDSLVQAIHLAWLLGFRKLYLAGCDMHVAPGPEWIREAQAVGTTYVPRELLRDFHQRCVDRGVVFSEGERAPATRQYHFDESKRLPAAIQTDLHYFRVAQYLRLSRRAMALAGLELISVTPGSRLNDYFPCQTVESVVELISAEIGDPQSESTRGLYTEQVRRAPQGLGPMRDYKPHHWPKSTATSRGVPSHLSRKERLAQLVAEVKETPVPIREEG